MKPGIYLALDLGDRHIGVAVSAPETGMVFARPTLHVGSEDEAVTAIETVVNNERPAAVVVGYPLTMRGDVGPQAAKVEAFVERLRPRLPCSVHLLDERMTTVEGERSFSLGDDHAQAARLILETFLAQP